MLRRWGLFGLRLTVLIITAGALLSLPDPAVEGPLRVKNALVVLVSLICAGKLLLDTLFYDRHPY